jgi:formamidopyrimidine-DNA glycosylase
MPELPEVETVSRGLRQRALGRRITGVEVLHSGVITGAPNDFADRICGRRVASVERKGKVLALGLEAGLGKPSSFLMMRLGMTGQVTVRRRAEPLEAHTHVRLTLDGGEDEIRFRDARRFGRLRACTREELDALLAGLGPDAQHMTEAEFLSAARGRRGAVKNWLLNQKGFSGLGNIYADESLYAARVHPLAQPGRLTRRSLGRLYRAVQKVLRRAVELQGTSFRDYIDIEGRTGNYQQRLNAYGREGQPCRRCRHVVRRIVVAGRSSHFCPRCQKKPRRATAESRPRNPKSARGRGTGLS